MKKIMAVLLSTLLSASVLAGCGPSGSTPSEGSQAPSSGGASSGGSQAAPSASGKAVELTVVTAYGSDDGNRGNYEEACKGYEEASGNKVIDNSGTSNEEWKARIMMDFQTGAEPDVLLYFNGIDSNALVEGGKVVSIDEIRAEYPDYASNMKDSAMGASPLDGKNYSVPVNGYWEGLFVNKNILSDCGVAIPGADYTWDQFLQDCETIKSKGYTPVAASLQEVPHYWFEFCTYNNGTRAQHELLPANSGDEIGKTWAAGLEDLKTMFEKGYFPVNTLTASDPETCQMLVDDQAAFLIDGSWKVGYFQDNADNIDDFTVTYVPAKGERKATDMIGGLSMGYYITRKAWDDPEKRDACVQFVQYMTTDEVVSKFGATSVTALKNGTIPPEDADSLVQAALDMTKNSTSVVAAVQDRLNKTARSYLFSAVKDVVSGKSTAAEVIDACLATEEAPEEAE